MLGVRRLHDPRIRAAGIEPEGYKRDRIRAVHFWARECNLELAPTHWAHAHASTRLPSRQSSARSSPFRNGDHDALSQR
jgi:hypothetical protein